MISFAGRSTGSPSRSGSSGRFWGFAWARRCSPCSSAPGLRRIRKAVRRSDIIRSAPRLQGSRSVRAGRIMSITGTMRDLNFPRTPNCWRRAANFPVEAFRWDHCFGFQFHPDVTYAMMHRWTTRGHARLELPGARARHHHFADRAVHDVTERAWLKAFLDGWLARVPQAMSEAAE